MNIKQTLLILTLSLGSFSLFSAMPERDRIIDRDIEKRVLEKDNTGLNRNQEMTAQSQAQATDADTELTRKLREKIMADNQLSTSAHNIKIITVNEAITLAGPVANKAEKVKIENFARSMAGKKKVYNRLSY